MQAATSMLIGEHDFSAFRAAGCQSSTAVREITRLEVVRQGEWVRLRVSANAFLQHMVRNIAGTLVAVGSGDESPSWVGEVLESRDRSRGGVAAPPHGLMLVAVEYPSEFALPANPPGYLR